MSGLNIGDKVYWVNYYTEGKIECGEVKSLNSNDVVVREFYGRYVELNRNRFYLSEIDAKISRSEYYIKKCEYRMEELKNELSSYQREKENLLIEKIAGI